MKKILTAWLMALGLVFVIGSVEAATAVGTTKVTLKKPGVAAAEQATKARKMPKKMDIRPVLKKPAKKTR